MEAGDSVLLTSLGLESIGISFVLVTKCNSAGDIPRISGVEESIW